ncbi:MAG: hypothetical protein OXC30_05550 [Alphaproteobacteria bacterium]|nr:hypothetical protein [Alphaproteobacteria bacterium]
MIRSDMFEDLHTSVPKPESDLPLDDEKNLVELVDLLERGSSHLSQALRTAGDGTV